MNESPETIERWFFYQDAAGLWKWARLDVFGEVLAYSGAAFATRAACLDDARHNGYREEGLCDPAHASRTAAGVERSPAADPRV